MKQAFAHIRFLPLSLTMIVIASSPNVSSAQAVLVTPHPDRPKLDWDYDGSRILGHIGNDICLWDAKTGRLLKRMVGHKERIVAVQFSPDGKHALSSSWMSAGEIMLKSKDTSVRIWNLERSRQSWNLSGYSKKGSQIQYFKGQVAGEFSPDGKRIITFSERKADLVSFDAAIWDVFSGRRLVTAKLDRYNNQQWDRLHFSPSGREFVCLDSASSVLYSASDGRELGRARVSAAYSLRYTSKGTLASFTKSGIEILNAKDGSRLMHMQPTPELGWEVAWSRDGTRAAGVPFDRDTVSIWNLESGKLISGGATGVFPRTLIISPDNSRLAVEWGGANSVPPMVGLFDMESGALIALTKIATWGRVLGFSPDSNTFLVGGSQFAIYSSETGEEIRSLDLLGEVDTPMWTSYG